MAIIYLTEQEEAGLPLLILNVKFIASKLHNSVNSISIVSGCLE